MDQGAGAEKAGDRSSVGVRGISYLWICEIYRDAGQHDRALKWAEWGLPAFPKKPAPGRANSPLANTSAADCTAKPRN